MHTPTSQKRVNIVSELAAKDTRHWYRKPNLRGLYLVLLPACVGAEMTSAFDLNLMTVLQATTSWKKFYDFPGATLLGQMTAIYSLGAICSLPFVPLVVDGRGRRASMILGCALMIFGAILEGLATNVHMFIAARFILGFGGPFSVVGSASLIAELSHPKERAVMTSLFTGFFGIGSIMVAAISLRTCTMRSNWGWRIPSFLQATPSIFQLIFIFMVPESPRWLIAKGRGSEASAILVKYHGEGDAQSEFVKAEYAEIEKTLREEINTGHGGWLELISTPAMRKRSMIALFLGVAANWTGGGLIGTYLPRILATIGIHNNLTKNRINLALSCWGLLCATSLAVIVPRFKRRTMFVISTVSILLILVGWTVATAQFTKSESHGSATAVLVFIFLFIPAMGLGYGALTYTYVMELFPFYLRAKGIVTISWFSRITGFFGQFVNPIGLQNAGWKYYISFCVAVTFQIVFIYFTFPETAGLTLEELAFLYEDKETQKAGERTMSSTSTSTAGSAECEELPRLEVA
ncbi:hexose transporter [Mycena metata]|uniref:Hexose transporter n=1 Tax=Mycena metata TaxID=1033252 RepID=A0AAD7NWW1_9AGAR|nr:hexose transporter [Mycena metata]